MQKYTLSELAQHLREVERELGRTQTTCGA
jgi:hypothetical protein